ncbi:MAG: radical SAM protein, partial [Gracilibacteraceae bacterium]|nr:radical SAM protein [Gracilibacteraceae bacterium]
MKTVRLDSASLPESVLNACGQVVRAFFPGVRFVGDGDVCICLEACFSEEFESESVSCGNPHSCPRAMYATLHTLSVSRLSFHVSHNLTRDEIAALWRLGLSWDRDPGEESFLRIAAQRVVLGLMEKVTGRVMPWGILTGVRPGRLWHKLTMAGLAPEARRGILARLYGVAEAKIDLLQDVGAAQEAVLRAWQDDCHVAVYVSIPFCPSRCSYCAFPGFPARPSEMAAYLGVLGDEIGLLAQDLETYGLRINAVYIGGGTPTALETGQLERLLESLTGLLPMAGAAEFCCEAGRPETLTADKLAVLAAAGVTRLCINPQTLDDGTLRRIGRSHSAGDFYRALELARRTASWHINADMILGLPGEGEGHAEKTIKGLVELAMDSVTVHYLTLKRGAALGSERREVGDGRDHGG